MSTESITGRAGVARLCTVVVVVALAGSSSSAAGQSSARAEGPMQRLTPETREQALACGREGRDCALTPYELCQENADYSVRLITPFSRVAEASLDAEEGRRPVGRIGPATVNRLGIALSVAPAARGSSTASIEQVTIQRDGDVVKPVQATVGPVMTRATDGTIRALNRGFFVFPATAFEPSMDVTITLTGSSGESSCRLDRRRLSALR